MAKLIGTGTNQVPTNGMLGGMAFQTPEDVTVEKIQENDFNVVTQTDIGTAPNQIPLNQFLGGLAYMDSVAGLDFSATSSASTGTVTSQILDDYEEGTFTPTAGNPAVSGTGITYSGSYVKIGNVVWVRVNVNATPNTNVQVSTYAIIEGLPFIASSDGGSTSTVVTEDIDVFSRQGFIAKGTNNDRLFLSACGSSSGTSNLTMSIVYKTA